MNNKINRLYERCFRIVHSDKTSSFEKLLEKDGSVTIHTRNLQTLATEMFKVYKNLSPAIIADLFHVRQNNYNLRHDSYFAIPNVKSVHHGTESLSNMPLRKKLKSGSRKTIHVGYVNFIYHMLVLFEVLSLYLFLKHKGLFYGRTL